MAEVPGQGQEQRRDVCTAPPARGRVHAMLDNKLLEVGQGFLRCADWDVVVVEDTTVHQSLLSRRHTSETLCLGMCITSSHRPRNGDDEVTQGLVVSSEVVLLTATGH